MLSAEYGLDPKPIQKDETSDFSFLRPLAPTLLFTIYWRFAVERQQIFLRRLWGLSAPWTSDPILTRHKFTNAYRASDRVSQYLIRRVIYGGDLSCREVFFRIILFKLFNKIETWELLERKLGTVRFEDFDFRAYDEVLMAELRKGSIYSGAYMMPSRGRGKGYARKHRMHLRLVERMMNDDLPQKIADAPSMQRAFFLLRSYPSLGDFLAYQYVIDLNYSNLTDFSEMDFVAPGPGARDGLKKCFKSFGGLTEAKVITLITEKQEECFRAVSVHFPTLWGRKLQLIDCQNLFCEVDKYAREAYPRFRGHSKRTNIKQKLKPSLKPLELWYPPKWHINERINEAPLRIPS